MDLDKKWMRTIFLASFWLMYGETMAAWEKAFGITVKVSSCLLVLIVISLVYSASFLLDSVWKGSSLTAQALLISLLAVMPLFNEVSQQIRQICAAVNKLWNQSYGIRIFIASERHGKTDCTLAFFWLMCLFFFISLYCYWKELPSILQVMPCVILFLVPVASDGVIPYHATIVFFGGILLFLMGVRRKGRDTLPAFLVGAAAFVLCLFLVSVFFPENVFESLTEPGDGPLFSAEAEKPDDIIPVDILQGEFDPDGRIHYEDITMFRLTVPARPDNVPFLYLKSFEGVTYDKGRWLGENDKNRLSYIGVFSRINSNTWEIERVAGKEDVVPYGDEAFYRLENGRILRGQGAWKSYKTLVSRMDRSFAMLLAKEISDVEGYEKEKQVSKPIRGFCKRQMTSVKADTYQELADSVKQYFQREYKYTQEPGKPKDGMDELLYFAKKTKRGYCVHFSSLAVHFFRTRGIPARYAQGYCIDTSKLRLNRAYEVQDYMAHAWVEINIDGAWVPVDVTPGRSSDYFGLGSGGSYDGQSEEAAQGGVTPSAAEAASGQPSEEEDGLSLKELFAVFIKGLTGLICAAVSLGAVCFAGKYLYCLWRRERMLSLRKKDEWRTLLWRLHVEFLRFLQTKKVVWDEESREGTKENIYYAFSYRVSFVYESEMHAFKEQINWYVDKLFAIRYGTVSVGREDVVRAVFLYKKILGKQKHFVFRRVFDVFCKE